VCLCIRERADMCVTIKNMKREKEKNKMLRYKKMIVTKTSS